MTTLEKIKTEIKQIADEEQKHDEKWAMGLRYAVKIIDKYADQEPCDDVVSRQAVAKLVRGCNSALEEPLIFDSHNSGVVFEQYINDLPSVRPQEPKAGKWVDIPFSHYFKCSECDKYQISETNYCPNCGARMESDK